ncbi:hypothetical protein F5X99DRAFT_395828 [Biscogniauxia marginata]|nr:hypothetical protein F5X99DRAFT_395828 [Biscogniauxia marginata]
MFAAASVVEFGGHHTLFKPPRGTCSRILSLRLRRHFHPSTHLSTRTSFLCSTTRAPARNSNIKLSSIYNGVYGLRYATTQAHVTITNEEIELIQDLFHRFGPKIQPRVTIKGGTGDNSAPNRVGLGVAAATDPVRRVPTLFKHIIEGIQSQNLGILVHHITKQAFMNDENLEDAIAVLPRTTFTELLRSLDPFRVARECDPTDQVHVSAGMYTMLNLDATIDEWGVRKLYLRLLPALLKLMMALRRSGQAILIEEYTYLLRCAGAASDPVVAKLIWNEMIKDNTTHWRQSDAYAEFVAARFLTIPMYTSYDKVRRMVLPRNLHRSRLLISNRKKRRLDRLRLNLRLHKYRFGLNRSIAHGEDIMRMLRRQNSARRLFQACIRDGYITESTLCAHMIALARSGSLRMIGSRILQDYFGIKMTRLTHDDHKINAEEIPRIHRLPDHVRVRPTVRLMRAVVEAYGSNGEISTAFQLIDHISDAHGIPIPPDVWNDLLQWTYIMASPPASTSWAILGWHSKIPSAAAVEMIWNTMTAEPYNLKPGFDQYSILIRNLLGRNLTEKALQFMREAIKRLYNAQCREFEQALFELIQCRRDGIGSSASSLRYEKAMFHKQRMWYDIHTWCHKLLLTSHNAYPGKPASGPTVPDLVREFRPFFTNPVRYRTPTGFVSLVDPTIETVRFAGRRSVAMAIPMKHRRTWVHQRINRWRPFVLSTHSLDPKRSSFYATLELLTGMPGLRRFGHGKDRGRNGN